MEKTVKELAHHVRGTIQGDGSMVITGAATLSEAGEGDISFLANPRYEKELRASSASAVIVGEKIDCPGKTLVRSGNPYYAFMQAVVLIYGHREHEKVGISERASVAANAKIGVGVDIHDFSVISHDVQIGDVVIY